MKTEAEIKKEYEHQAKYWRDRLSGSSIYYL
jgi:hypothetical protein